MASADGRTFPDGIHVSVTDLPALNASLNAISTVLLVTGYVFIRRREREKHRACMIAALVTSALFLTSYVIYHAQVGSVPFKGTGWIRTLYVVVLVPHVILAAAIVPPILITASRGLSAKYDKHRRIARWTLPLWLYVSVTGVIVYRMLYQL
jgi:putative membrane protein